MKTFVLGFVLGVALLPLSVYLYFRLGMAPVGTSEPMMPFENNLARMALRARVRGGAPRTVPLAVDEPTLLAGSRVYTRNCSVCHGLPGQPPTAISTGMFPPPPHMFKGQGVTKDPVPATYWKTANGIRLSGMPAFGPSLSETELWQVALLLANAEKLPPSVQASLKSAMGVAADTLGK